MTQPWTLDQGTQSKGEQFHCFGWERMEDDGSQHIQLGHFFSNHKDFMMFARQTTMKYQNVCSQPDKSKQQRKHRRRCPLMSTTVYQGCETVPFEPLPGQQSVAPDHLNKIWRPQLDLSQAAEFNSQQMMKALYFFHERTRFYFSISDMYKSSTISHL